MIIDCRIHLFPFLGSAWGRGSQEAHPDYLKKVIYGAARPATAAKPDFGTSELDINFKAGKFGRMKREKR